jgi:hypothetical protein
VTGLVGQGTPAIDLSLATVIICFSILSIGDHLKRGCLGH